VERPADRELPRGVVTFLLTDIEGSTPLWERHPDVMASVVERHDQLIAGIVGGHDGVFLRSRGEGDSTFSVFSRASPAAAAAIAIQDAIAAERWPDGLDLRVRIGVHTGEAVDTEGQYLGTTVNRAARLRGVAAGGQIIVSQSVAELVGDALDAGVALVDAGEQTLRGLVRPERVYTLVRRGAVDATSRRATRRTARGRPPLPSALAGGADAPFAGRDAESAALDRAWADVLGGARRVVFVGGEAGIGTTRLVGEFAARVDRAGGRVAYGACEEGLGVAFQPFVEIGRALDDDGAVTRVASMSSTDDEGPRRVRAAVDELVARLDDPALLVCDDLHFALRPTLLVLREFARAPASVPLLVVGGFRATELGPTHPLVPVLADLRRVAGVERIELDGLSVADLAVLVPSRTGDDAPSDALRDLHALTGGNPFLVLELLAAIDAPSATDLGAAFDDDATTNAIPDAVRASLGRRIGLVSDATGHALRVASVLGDRFPVAALEAAVARGAGGAELGRPDAVLDALDEAREAGLLVDGGDGSYAFRHGLVRRVLLTGMSAARRRRLTAAAADST